MEESDAAQFIAALTDGTPAANALGRLATLGALEAAPCATTAAWSALVTTSDWYPALGLWLCANRHALRVGIGHWQLDAATLTAALPLQGRSEGDQFVEWCAAAALPLRDAWLQDGGTPTAVADRWFPSSSSWDAVRAHLGIRSWYDDSVVAASWLNTCFSGPIAPSVVVRSRHDAATLDALVRPTWADVTERWSAALVHLVEADNDASLTRAQQVTLLHPRWKELWTQSGWTLRRSRIAAAERWRRGHVGGVGVVELTIGSGSRFML